MSNAAYAASQVRKTPTGGLRGDVARLIWRTVLVRFGVKLKAKFGVRKKA